MHVFRVVSIDLSLLSTIRPLGRTRPLQDKSTRPSGGWKDFSSFLSWLVVEFPLKSLCTPETSKNQSFVGALIRPIGRVA